MDGIKRRNRQIINPSGRLNTPDLLNNQIDKTHTHTHKIRKDKEDLKNNEQTWPK